MGMFESLAHYFIKPVAAWLIILFVAEAFMWPMVTTWAGDLLATFWAQAVDQVRGLFW